MDFSPPPPGMSSGGERFLDAFFAVFFLKHESHRIPPRVRAAGQQRLSLDNSKGLGGDFKSDADLL